MNELIDEIGGANFAPCLVDFLSQQCEADYCTAFRLDATELRVVSTSSRKPVGSSISVVERYLREGWWRRDPAIMNARACAQERHSGVVRFDINDSNFTDLRQSIFSAARDRVLLYGRRKNSVYCLSILKAWHHAEFSTTAVQRLGACADSLLSTVAKHAEISASNMRRARALEDIDEIQSVLFASGMLKSRELHVCARIIFGMKTPGIAVDLGLSEESVKTYRKRAYERIQIGTERELLVWYLDNLNAHIDCSLDSVDATDGAGGRRH